MANEHHNNTANGLSLYDSGYYSILRQATNFITVNRDMLILKSQPTVLVFCSDKRQEDLLAGAMRFSQGRRVFIKFVAPFPSHYPSCVQLPDFGPHFCLHQEAAQFCLERRHKASSTSVLTLVQST